MEELRIKTAMKKWVGADPPAYLDAAMVYMQFVTRGNFVRLPHSGCC